MSAACRAVHEPDVWVRYPVIDGGVPRLPDISANSATTRHYLVFEIFCPGRRWLRKFSCLATVPGQVHGDAPADTPFEDETFVGDRSGALEHLADLYRCVGV